MSNRKKSLGCQPEGASIRQFALVREAFPESKEKSSSVRTVNERDGPTRQLIQAALSAAVQPLTHDQNRDADVTAEWSASSSFVAFTGLSSCESQPARIAWRCSESVAPALIA